VSGSHGAFGHEVRGCDAGFMPVLDKGDHVVGLQGQHSIWCHVPGQLAFPTAVSVVPAAVGSDLPFELCVDCADLLAGRYEGHAAGGEEGRDRGLGAVRAEVSGAGE